MLPPSPVPEEPNAPPVEAPKAGVPNPVVKPVVVPSPEVPKVPVFSSDPNAPAPGIFVPPRPVVVPNGLLRELVPVELKVPVKPVGFL